MSKRERYPSGVPCWVETLQPDPRAALDFYGPLFGWEFAGSTPGDSPDAYFVARLKGGDVAGIGPLPDGGPPAGIWSTYVRVDSVDAAVERAKGAGGSLLVGPLDAPPAGRLAVLVDRVGAAVCVWEAQAREGAQLVNEAGTWAMSSLHTTDAEGANAFYGSVFGWQPESFGRPEAPITLWRRPGYVGGEAHQPVPRDVVAVMAPTGEAGAAVPPHWNVNFRVDDADATAAQASRLGGTVIAAPQDTPGFRSAVLGDPQGAVFSISQLTAGP